MKQFPIIFTPIYENVNRILSKKQRKTFKKGSLKSQNLSEKEKNKKRQFTRKRYRDLSEEEKEKNVNMAVNNTKIF